MKRILCTLPNASLSINGVDFVAHKMGVLSAAPVDDETAAHFLSIPGYRDFDEVKAELAAAAKADEPAEETQPVPSAPASIEPEGEPSPAADAPVTDAPAAEAAAEVPAEAAAPAAAEGEKVVAAPKRTAQAKK